MIWGKLGTVVQGYTLNPCTRFHPNPTSKKVNNEELTFQQPTKELRRVGLRRKLAW